MGKAFLVLLLTIGCIFTKAYAASPSLTCPTGYIEIEAPYITIAETTCPSGQTNIGIAYSCLESSPTFSCIMYAPADVTYSDESGSYTFTSACPLE